MAGGVINNLIKICNLLQIHLEKGLVKKFIKFGIFCSEGLNQRGRFYSGKSGALEMNLIWDEKIFKSQTA